MADVKPTRNSHPTQTSPRTQLPRLLNATPLDPKLLPSPKKEPKKPPQTYPDLEEKYRLAIDMRNLNYRYPIIAARLKKAGHETDEGTIRHWFAIGGVCHDVYEMMRQIRVEELKKEIEEADKQIKEGVVDAIAILRTSLNRALDKGELTESDYSIAKDMLDRGGYPKQSRSSVDGRIESDTLAETNALFRQILEKK